MPLADSSDAMRKLIRSSRLRRPTKKCCRLGRVQAQVKVMLWVMNRDVGEDSLHMISRTIDPVTKKCKQTKRMGRVQDQVKVILWVTDQAGCTFMYRCEGSETRCKTRPPRDRELRFSPQAHLPRAKCRVGGVGRAALCALSNASHLHRLINRILI